MAGNHTRIGKSSAFAWMGPPDNTMYCWAEQSQHTFFNHMLVIGLYVYKTQAITQ